MKVATALLAAALLGIAPAVVGHGGEDHGAPPPAVSQAVAPRASAATEEFEVVAVLEEKQIVIYVDRFASNEPVAHAKIELEGAGLKGIASEVAPGTYVMGLATAIPPARHPLTISIEAGDTADLLSANLDTSPAVDHQVHVAGWSVWAVWIIAALLLVASGALLLARRTREKAGDS
jgi:hypothetical protein